MFSLEEALKKFIAAEVVKEVTRHFAFLSGETEDVVNANDLILDAMLQAQADENVVTVKARKPHHPICITCKKAKPQRWINSRGECTKCVNAAPPPEKTGPKNPLKKCTACGERRRAMDSDGICRFCHRKGAGPVTTNRLVTVPETYPPYYKDTFDLFHIAKFCVSDICEYVPGGLSLDGARRVLASWKARNLATEISSNSKNPEAHTWALTPPGTDTGSMRYRSCARKRAYISKDRAESDMVYYKDRGKPGAEECHVYKCSFAEHFHIGGKDREKLANF